MIRNIAENLLPCAARHSDNAGETRAVLFDLGHTLIHYPPISRRQLFQEASWHTYQLWARRNKRMPDFRRYYLHQWSAMQWGGLKALLMRREIDAMRLMRRACRKLWLEADDAFFHELGWQWYRPLADRAFVEPEVYQVLEALRDRGLKLGIVSNTFIPGYVLDRHLRQLNLLEYFPVRVYSCDVGYRKPDRRIFDEALRRLEVNRQQTIFIGDLVDADVRGAQRAGMRAIWKPPIDEIDQEDGQAETRKITERLPRSVRWRIHRVGELPTLLNGWPKPQPPQNLAPSTG